MNKADNSLIINNNRSPNTKSSAIPPNSYSEWNPSATLFPQASSHMTTPHIDPFDPQRVPPYPPPPQASQSLNHMNGNPVMPGQNFLQQPHYGKLPTPFSNEYQSPNGPHYVSSSNHGYGPGYPPMSVPYPAKIENKIDAVTNSNIGEKSSHEGPYKHWEQPSDGIVHDSQQQNVPIPSRPSSAQEKHRATPDRRTPGRSPGLGESHQLSTLINGLNGVQSMPQISPSPYPGGHIYGHPPMYGMNAPTPYIASTNQPNMPFNVGYSVEGKKMRLDESDPIHSEANRNGPSQTAIENSFQVPSASSSRHPFNGTIPQSISSMNSHNLAQSSMRMPQMPEHWDQSSNHQNSNLMANAPSTPTSGQSANKSPNSDSDKITKKKRKRCGNCPGCLRKDNCGDCGPCKSVRSHQICKMRKCDQLKTKKEKVREVRISYIWLVYVFPQVCFTFAIV